MNEFNTDWDPYEELMAHRNNIQQCALAINTGSELMKELGQKYQHQQEVIQNKKLQQMIEVLKNQVITVSTDIELMKMRNNA